MGLTAIHQFEFAGFFPDIFWLGRFLLTIPSDRERRALNLLHTGFFHPPPFGSTPKIKKCQNLPRINSSLDATGPFVETLTLKEHIFIFDPSAAVVWDTIDEQNQKLTS